MQFSQQKLTLLLYFSWQMMFQLTGQSVANMEAKLNNPATPKSERMSLSFSLAENLMRSQPAKAADYAHRAAMLASELNDEEREVAAYLLAGEAHVRRRDTREANSRFNRAYTLAKNYGQTDRAIEALKEMQQIAAQKNDYREAYRLSQEGVALLHESRFTIFRSTSGHSHGSGGGRSGGY